MLIRDTWICTRPKVKYYGAYPSGFLQPARFLLGASKDDTVLHVCSGMVKLYPYKDCFGEYDITLDINPDLKPDLVHDVTADGRLPDAGEWKYILADPPYTEEDAKHYGEAKFPEPNALLRKCLDAVQVGGRVGFLHYIWPNPPKFAIERAAITVGTGRNNRARYYTVYERLS